MAPAPLPAPALFPPADGVNHTWPTPNFVNPETRGWSASICIIILFAFTLCVFCARVWARFYVTRTQGLDDWLIIASMPILLGLTIATVLALRVYGFQLHIYDQTPKTSITVRQITLAMETIYLGTTTLTKISILIFYRRVTSSLISRPLFIALWASIIFVAAYGITFVIVLIFTCWPVEAYWYRFTTSWLKAHPNYKCNDELTTLMVIISISTVQDFIACILPMFVVRKLRLPYRQKVALIFIFGMGLGTCAVGALRLHYAHRVYYYVKSHSPTYDITWEALGAWVSTAVEANLAIICASAPALNVFCHCLRSGQREERTFGWYGGAKPQASGNSRLSKISKGSKTVVRMACCFGCMTCEVKLGSTSKGTGKSSRNDSAFASTGAKSQATRTSEHIDMPQAKDFDLDRGMLNEWPQEVELRDQPEGTASKDTQRSPVSHEADDDITPLQP